MLPYIWIQDGYTLEAGNNDDAYSAVSDICGALYGESAKCNRYMGNDGSYAVSDAISRQFKREIRLIRLTLL